MQSMLVLGLAKIFTESLKDNALVSINMLLFVIIGVAGLVFLFFFATIWQEQRITSALRRGDYAAALRWLDSDRWLPRRLRVSHQTRYRGLTLLLAGRYAEAEAELQRRLAADARSADALDTYANLDNLGWVALEQQRYDEAEFAFRRAQKIQPQQSPPCNGLAELMLRQGARAEEALAQIAQGLDCERARGRSEELEGVFLAQQAWAQAQLGRAAEAEASLARALAIAAAHELPPMRLAMIYMHAGRTASLLGNTRLARTYFEQARATEPQGRGALLADAALRDLW